jgi:hypothetical protein
LIINTSVTSGRNGRTVVVLTDVTEAHGKEAGTNEGLVGDVVPYTLDGRYKVGR